MPDVGKIRKGTPQGITKAMGVQEETGHQLVLALLECGVSGKAEGGPLLYCRRCGKYTMRNCKGLKERCPGKAETRKAWLLRLGKEKKHPTNPDLAISQEWDVSFLKAGWESEHKGKEVAGLRRVMEVNMPCRVEAVELQGGKSKGGELQVSVVGWPQHAAEEDEEGVAYDSTDEERYAAGGVCGYESERRFFYGAFPNWGVG